MQINSLRCVVAPIAVLLCSQSLLAQEAPSGSDVPSREAMTAVAAFSHYHALADEARSDPQKAAERASAILKLSNEAAKAFVAEASVTVALEQEYIYTQRAKMCARRSEFLETDALVRELKRFYSGLDQWRIQRMRTVEAAMVPTDAFVAKTVFDSLGSRTKYISVDFERRFAEGTEAPAAYIDQVCRILQK